MGVPLKAMPVEVRDEVIPGGSELLKMKVLPPAPPETLQVAEYGTPTWDGPAVVEHCIDIVGMLGELC